MARSQKTAVIENIFNQRWDDEAGELSDPIVSLDEVTAAIREYNATLAEPSSGLSDRNPANFMKDFTRSNASANANWPESVLRRGFTGRQSPGEGNCFEFVPLLEGQIEAFPSNAVPPPSLETPRHLVQSLELPIASRLLGRADEPWLMQVVVRLGVIESHLAFSSTLDVQQVDHLQMSVKLSSMGSEVDALYLASVLDKQDDAYEVIITCEAKGLKEDLSINQVIRQVKAVFQLSGVYQDWIVPMAIKVVGKSELHVIEFKSVGREDAESLEELDIVSESVIIIRPNIPGLG